jgi:hypothetical protein
VGVFRRSAGGATLLVALIAVAALPPAAPGRVTYPGPRFGAPFQVRVSGVMRKQWQITEQTAPCEFAGSGSQTVTFRTAGWTRARVFSVDRLHSRRDDFYELEADVPLVLTVTRTDNTVRKPSDSNTACGAELPHNCGTRTVTIPRIPVRVRNHVLELDVMRDGTPGALANAVDQLYPVGSNCRYPNAEDVLKHHVAWPGNRRFLRPGSHGSFTARQGTTTRPGSVTSSDTLITWGTSEQYSGSFSLRTRNRCRPVSRSVQRSVGYVCDSRNGTVLAR